MNLRVIYGDTASVLAKPIVPAVTGGLIILQDASGAQANDAANGASLWQYKFPQGHYSVSAGGALAGNLFFLYSNQSIFAINATNGLLKWQFTPSSGQLPNSAIYPVANSNLAFVPAGDKLYAIDATTGTQKWVLQAPYTITHITIADDRVFIGSADRNSVYAINTATGTVVQTYTGARCSANPAAINGVLLVPSLSSLMAFDISSGQLKWEYKGGFTTAPTVYNETVFFTYSVGGTSTNETRLTALLLNTGVVKWEFTTPATQNTAYFEISVNDGLAVLSVKNYANTQKGTIIRMMDANSGSLKWETTYAHIPNISGDIISTPLVAGKVAYASFYDKSSYSRGLLAFETSTGIELWRKIDANNSTVRPLCVQTANGKSFYLPSSGMQQ